MNHSLKTTQAESPHAGTNQPTECILPITGLSALTAVLLLSVAALMGCKSKTARVAELSDPFLNAASDSTIALQSSSSANRLAVSEPAVTRDNHVQLVAYDADRSESITRDRNVLAVEVANQEAPLGRISVRTASADPAVELRQPTSLPVPVERTETAPTPIEEGAPLATPAADVIRVAQTGSAEIGSDTGAREMPFSDNVYPIDLSNALSLGGADHLQVRLARTRLYQAQARYFKAKALWLPSLRAGIGYSKHDGRLQQTEGDVLEINRNSTFFGGGLGLGSVPLPAGSGGPPRLFVALSLADAAFTPLAACQEVAAHGAAERAAQNDALTSIAVAYHGLVEAQGLLANAQAAEQNSMRLVEQVEVFEREGFSSKTEVSRAKAATARRRSMVVNANRIVRTRSAELARLLRLPPTVQLVPAEEVALPVEMLDVTADAEMLVAEAVAVHPELKELAALREAACWRVRQEELRPWIPNVQVGTSAGEFGGGPSSTYRDGGSRSDVELLAVWEWENLGLGNLARQRIRRGELHERVLELEAQREQIAAEVVARVADVEAYREQITIAEEALLAASESYRLNDLRIRESEGLPIELLQSISALAEAQDTYTEAVANYNRAQHQLLRALGRS